MPSSRTELARRHDFKHPASPSIGRRPRERTAQANPYASMLCPVLAQGLGGSIDHAMVSTLPESKEAFLSLAAAFRDATSGDYQGAKSEFKILRALLKEPPRQRLCLAKHCYTLLGANLDAGSRLQGLRTLRAAAAFGQPRLAHIVEMCVPLARAPERRLAMLDGLWRRVGPAQLPHLMAVCRPVLDQRRYVPEEASRAMERVLECTRQADRPDAAADRLGRPANEAPLEDLGECCPQYVGDDNENVMISSRIASAQHAISIVRAHVPDALHFAPVLACVELFVEGFGQHGCAKTQARCQVALQTLTGRRKAEITPWRQRGARAAASLWHAAGLPPFGVFDVDRPPSTPTESKRDARRLWRNVQLPIEGADPIGMGELCSLIWQAIHRYRDPEGGWAQTRRKRANMRHALVSALADCNEKQGIVCPVGISQRLLTVVQGYLPFTIDGVEEEAHPQSVVTYLIQSFAHRCHQEQKAMSSIVEGARWDAAEPARVIAFYKEALQTGQTLLGHRPAAHDIFKKHLVTALDNLYEADYLEGDRLED